MYNNDTCEELGQFMQKDVEGFLETSLIEIATLSKYYKLEGPEL